MRHFLTPLLFVCAPLALAGNALVNGDFENDLDGWVVWGGSVSQQVHRSGEKACMVRATAPTWMGVSQTLAIPEARKSVRVSGWMKADSLKSGKENWERGRLSVEFFGAKGDTLGGYPPAAGQIRGTLGWTRYERTYEIPAGTRTLKLGCALGNSYGTLYCDDLAVEFLP